MAKKYRRKTKSRYGGGSVGELPSGRFRAQWYEARQDDKPGHTRRSKAFDTEEQAWEFLAAMKDWQKLGLVSAPGSKSFKLAAIMWLGAQEGSALTMEGYRSLVYGHLLPACGTKPMDKLDTEYWSLFKRAKLKGEDPPLSFPQPERFRKKLSPSKVRECLRIAHNIYDFAMTRTPPWYVGINPLDPKLLKRPATQERNFMPLEDSELRALVAEIPDEFAMLTHTLHSLGLRLSEALALQWSDYAVDEHRLHILRTVKRGEDYMFGPPKSKRGVRDFIVSEDFHRRLMEHKETVELMPSNQHNLMFPSRAGTLINRSNYHRMFTAAVRRAGINRRVRVHDLRHTFAARQRRGGNHVAAEVVSARMGHASVGFTLSTYRRFFQAELDTPADIPL